MSGCVCVRREKQQLLRGSLWGISKCIITWSRLSPLRWKKKQPKTSKQPYLKEPGILQGLVSVRHSNQMPKQRICWKGNGQLVLPNFPVGDWGCKTLLSLYLLPCIYWEWGGHYSKLRVGLLVWSLDQKVPLNANIFWSERGYPLIQVQELWLTSQWDLYLCEIIYMSVFRGFMEETLPTVNERINLRNYKTLLSRQKKSYFQFVCKMFAMDNLLVKT